MRTQTVQKKASELEVGDKLTIMIMKSVGSGSAASAEVVSVQVHDAGIVVKFVGGNSRIYDPDKILKVLPVEERTWNALRNLGSKT